MTRWLYSLALTPCPRTRFTLATNHLTASCILLSTGHQSLQIGISSFANYTGLDVQVKIGETAAQIQAQTACGIDVVLPALADGWYNLSVILNDIIIGSDG